MQLKPLLTLSIIFSLEGCGGLKPTVCVSSPKENMLRCDDYEKNLKLTKLFSEIDNWSCESPSDFQNVLEACKFGRPGPTVNHCIADSKNELLHCFDQATSQSNLIHFADSENFVCLSARDEQNLLDYCKTIKPQKEKTK